MTTKHDNEPTERSDDAAAGKRKRPETVADFMALDTVVGAVSSNEDGYDGTAMSVDTGKQFTEMLWEKYQREQAEARCRKKHKQR